jgi:hypothetical protein
MAAKRTSPYLAPLPHASEHGRKLPGSRGARAWFREGVADARSDGYTDRRARRRPTEATPARCPPGTNSYTPEVGAEMTADGASQAGGEIAKSDPPRRPTNGSESTGGSAAKRGTELSAGGSVAGRVLGRLLPARSHLGRTAGSRFMGRVGFHRQTERLPRASVRARRYGRGCCSAARRRQREGDADC